MFFNNTKDEEKVFLKWQPGLEKHSTAEERNRRIQAFILTEHNVCVCVPRGKDVGVVCNAPGYTGKCWRGGGLTNELCDSSMLV